MKILLRLKNKIRHTLRPVQWFLKRKLKKVYRYFKKSNNNFYTFAIVCVKRPEYINLAIENTNSLHYINPSHKFVIYCDNICAESLQKNFWQLDYPKHVIINNAFGEADKPWQYYKLETIIEISKKDWLLVDADARWHHDPIIDTNKVTFLVSPKKIKEKEDETLIVRNIFQREDWLEFGYYSSGFLSIPSKFMTEKVAQDSRIFLTKLLDSKFEFLQNENQRDDQRRQAEQFALNLGILSNHPEDYVTTLKEKDGTKDTNLLQSLYYGCEHKINE